MAKSKSVSRIPAPKNWWRRSFERPFVYDLMIAWFALFGAIATALRTFAVEGTLSITAGVLYVIAALGVLFAACWKFRVQWGQHEEASSVHDLEGCLVVLHTQLMLALTDEEQPRQRIRLAIHIPDASGQNLIQALDYVGIDYDERTAGRTQSVHSGVAGRAFLENTCIVASRRSEDHDEYIEYLEKEWGYSNKEARSKDPSTKAWIAVPIGDPPEGVLYGDANVKDFFSEERVIQLISTGATAISRYLELRY